MFASNQHVYIPPYPPPPLPSASVRDTSSTNLVSTFTHRLHQFLVDRQTTINSSKQKRRQQNALPKIKLSDVTNEMRRCYEMIDEVNAECASLMAQNEQISQTEWNARLQVLQTKQMKVVELTAKYMAPNVQTAVHQQLEHRKGKRMRIQKRKKETKEWRQQQIHMRDEKHRLIDEQIQKATEAIEKQRQQTQDEQKDERLLSKVKRMKCDATKNIDLIESLIELHRVRRVRNSLNDHFERDVVDELAMLKTQWLFALATYETDEKRLHSKTRSTYLYDEWHQALFVASTSAQSDPLQSIETMDDLIRVRHAWDAFIVNQSHLPGSTVPIGWITPSEHPLDEWRIYKKN